MNFNDIFEKNVTFNNFKSQKVGLLHLLSLENEFLENNWCSGGSN